MQFHSQGSLCFLQFELLAQRKEIQHAVFSRKGGISPPPCEGLNLGLNTPDEIGNVLDNREKIRAHFDHTKLLIPNQKHSTHIEHYPFLTPQFDTSCDAVMTQETGVSLFIQHADCQAAIFFDPVKRCIANVHCGWRGNAQFFYSKVIESMQNTFGTDVKDLIVCISPSLGPERAEFVRMKEEFPPELWKYAWKENYLDLWKMSKGELLEKGVLEKNIEIASLCTYEEEELFFSYRRDKQSGRNATLVRLL